MFPGAAGGPGPHCWRRGPGVGPAAAPLPPCPPAGEGACNALSEPQ